jgi:hypothetical protein
MKVFDLSKQMEEALREVARRGLEGFEEAVEAVKPIVMAVKEQGDEAVKAYDKTFSKVARDYEIKVSRDEIEEAYSKVDQEFVEALRKAIEVVRRFHEEERPRPWIKEVARGLRAGVIPRPVDVAGLYIPGGRAPYPSTAVMTGSPGQGGWGGQVGGLLPSRPRRQAEPLRSRRAERGWRRRGLQSWRGPSDSRDGLRDGEHSQGRRDSGPGEHLRRRREVPR